MRPIVRDAALVVSGVLLSGIISWLRDVRRRRLANAAVRLAGSADRRLSRFRAGLALAVDGAYAFSAGHPPGLWLNRNGQLKEELRRTGLPLGIRPDTEYTMSEPMALKRGDLLAIMTDGVEEAMSANQELFGEERIIETLAEHQSEPPAQIVAKLHEAGRAFGVGDAQGDDFTTIVLKAK